MAVYLIHFDRPISENHTTQHYLGYAQNLEKRIEHHHRGTSGVRLFQVAKERKIGFVVVRVWEDGDKNFERKLKNGKNFPKLCPVCKKNRIEK